MFKGFTEVIHTTKLPGDVYKALAELVRKDVLVGIPQAESSRKDATEPNNAELAYIHTNGSPRNRIPARPFLQPAIMAHKDNIAKLQGKVIRAALKGDVQLMLIDLEKVGLYAQNVTKAWFVDPRNGWPPNAPLTIKLKGSDKPLIDTGALRNSITYVIRE